MMGLRLFIGWDGREAIAFHVLVHSILRRASRPVDIIPLRLDALRRQGLYRRPTLRRDGRLWDLRSDAPMATDFALTRFLVPHLAGHRGWAAFMDCDMLCLDDIALLFDLADPRYAIQCVQHDHRPRASVKMDGQCQVAYPRKNWSSLVLWNCAHPAHGSLTLDRVNSAPGRDLHRFDWLTDRQIGALPPGWNWLVGEQPRPDPLHIAHFTSGGPWFAQSVPADRDASALWLAEASDVFAFPKAA